MKLSYKTYNLPFKYPFTISKGSKTHQPTLVVELDHFGIKGYGEAPAIGYYNVTVEKMIADIESKRQFIEKFSLTDPERYWHYLHHLFPANPFIVCALDMAGWDIYGKMKRMQLHQMWKLNPADAPLTDYTIGIDSIEKMIEKMKDNPWPVYKIKMGGESDLQMVEELRKHTDAVFRVDANAAWKVDEAVKKIKVLKDLNVQLVEQPLAKDDWEGMQILYNESPLPLFADESCVGEADVLKCYKHFHGVNIKLTKCSGLTPARRMITKARELEMSVMLGCMCESTIGTSAMAQLAPLADFTDLDGPLLLAEDIAAGITFNAGAIVFNSLPGIGIDFTF